MAANEFNPSDLTAHELLRQYAGILRELRDRGVIRTLNAPAGDLAETLTAAAYSGHLAPNSEKSWDVTAGDGRRLQVKSRVIAASALSSPIQFSVFRSWGFDAAIFVVFAAETYEVLAAYEVPASSVQQRANVSAWVGGHRLTLSLVGLAALPACVDVTSSLQAALETLDAAG
jgi:hypothetical protein